MKRMICMLLCVVLALGMVGCADAKPESGTTSGKVEVPNPFRTCENLDEAYSYAVSCIPGQTPEQWQAMLQ